jgi:hypothetical protein
MKLRKNVAVSDSGFLFNSSTGDSYSVNPIGMEILQLLQSQKEKEEIRQYVMNSYVCDEATFEKDFYDFSLMLRSYKLMEEDEQA